MFGVRVKGVLLAGGTGSRLHPLTRITNKHLLPIYDRPMIAYGIEALVKAGISEIMVVTGGTHAGEFLRLLSNGEEYGVGLLTYAYQDRPGGIAEALGLAERFVGDDLVLVMLADNIFGKTIRPTVEAFVEQGQGARIVLARDRRTRAPAPSRGARARCDGQGSRIVEKPDVPPSNYCVTGVYCYDPSVFSVISTLKPSSRGELEITDVNNAYVEAGEMEFDVLEGFWGDAGESIDAYYVVNDEVRRYGANLEEYRALRPSSAGSSALVFDHVRQAAIAVRTSCRIVELRVGKSHPSGPELCRHCPLAREDELVGDPATHAKNENRPRHDKVGGAPEHAGERGGERIALHRVRRYEIHRSGHLGIGRDRDEPRDGIVERDPARPLSSRAETTSEAVAEQR